MQYRIRVEQLNESKSTNYDHYDDIYSQVVTGDDTIISAIMLTVWRYIESLKDQNAVDMHPDELTGVKPIKGAKHVN